MFDDTHPSLVAGICGAVISFVLIKVFGVIDVYCKRQQDVKSLAVLYRRSRPVLQRMGNDDSGIPWTKALDDADSIRVPWYNVFNILKLHKIMKDPTSDIYTTIAAAQLVVAAERVQAPAVAPDLAPAVATAAAPGSGHLVPALALAPGSSSGSGQPAPGSSSGSGQPAQAIDAARVAIEGRKISNLIKGGNISNHIKGGSIANVHPASFGGGSIASVHPVAFQGFARLAFERGKEAVFESNEEIEIACYKAGDCEDEKDEEADDFTEAEAEAEAAAAAALALATPPPLPSPKKDENGLYLRQKGKQKVGESIELDVALDDKEGKDKTL